MTNEELDTLEKQIGRAKYLKQRLDNVNKFLVAIDNTKGSITITASSATNQVRETIVESTTTELGKGLVEAITNALCAYGSSLVAEFNAMKPLDT